MSNEWQLVPKDDLATVLMLAWDGHPSASSIEAIRRIEKLLVSPASPVAGPDAATVERCAKALEGIHQPLLRYNDGGDIELYVCFDGAEFDRPDIAAAYTNEHRARACLSVASPITDTDRMAKMDGLKVGFLICPRCGERIETDMDPDGCRDPNCPMQGKNR